MRPKAAGRAERAVIHSLQPRLSGAVMVLIAAPIRRNDAVTLLSWKPVNFDRWISPACATSHASPVQASNLVVAIERMRLSWDRLREDLGGLFVPSGAPGIHAHHHFHAPADPDARERVLNACTVVPSGSRSTSRGRWQPRHDGRTRTALTPRSQMAWFELR